MTDPQFLLAAAVVVCGVIIWIIRLEGRVNTANAEAARLDKELAAVRLQANLDADAHTKTKEALIRVEEQIKHLASLIERHFSSPEPRTRTRRTGE